MFYWAHRSRLQTLCTRRLLLEGEHRARHSKPYSLGVGWDLLPLLLEPALPNKALTKQLCGWFVEGELNSP